MILFYSRMFSPAELHQKRRPSEESITLAVTLSLVLSAWCISTLLPLRSLCSSNEACQSEVSYFLIVTRTALARKSMATEGCPDMCEQCISSRASFNLCFSIPHASHVIKTSEVPARFSRLCVLAFNPLMPLPKVLQTIFELVVLH